MLILAGVSLNALLGDNGIITNAQRASVMSRFSTYKEELGMNILEDTGVYASGDKLRQYIPSMEDQDIDKFVVMKSELLYIATDELETSVAQSLGLGGISGETSDSGAAIKEIQNIISGVVELKDNFVDKVPADDSQLLDEPEHTNNADGLIGTRLFDRNALNMASHTWNILDEYNSKNEKTARYGSGYYWLKKGVIYTIDGESIEFKNDYVVDYAKNEYTVLSGRAVNWNENSTLAVTEGLVLNVDPMSLADGEWINNETGKTYEEELENAEAIVDEETKVLELNKVRNENFYNFYVTNTITGIKTDTGTQKIGDTCYDENIKAIKFNEDNISNPSGEGGYLKLMKSGVDFTNGFTFEIYANLDRILIGEYGKSLEENGGRHLGSGLFCRIPYLGADYKLALRFGYTTEYTGSNYIAKVYGPPKNLNSAFYVSNHGKTSVHGSFDPPDSNPLPGYEVGKDFYLTCTYIYYDNSIESEKYDEYMIENNVDKIEYYIDGELLYYTYYPNEWYTEGLKTWNKDECPFFVGVCPWYQNDCLFFLKGKVYSTRLYTDSFTSEQVKNNYDMTLKYRSSF